MIIRRFPMVCPDQRPAIKPGIRSQCTRGQSTAQGQSFYKLFIIVRGLPNRSPKDAKNISDVDFFWLFSVCLDLYKYESAFLSSRPHKPSTHFSILETNSITDTKPD